MATLHPIAAAARAEELRAQAAQFAPVMASHPVADDPRGQDRFRDGVEELLNVCLISSARVQLVATIPVSDDPTAANAAKELAGLLTKEPGREVKVLSDLEVAWCTEALVFQH